MRKRIIVLSLMSVMAIAVMGCGDKTEQTENVVSEAVEKNKETVEDAGDTNAAGVEPDSVAAEDTADADSENGADDLNDTEPDTESDTELDTEPDTESETEPDTAGPCDAVELVRSMKIGWNLGNTLDASSDQNKEDELAYESDWCGIVTTKEMVDAVKAAGFQTMRIPVSWHNHVSQDGSYTISDVWMNRVQEVVDYAIDNDMYVIINIHHDNSTDYVYPSQEYLEQSKAYVTSIWTQVAERFADYDEHLIMEGLNEPRLVGTNNEWWLDLNNGHCVEAVQCINELNQAFVDAVRASGGRNKERYLLVPGYAASLQGATNEYFELPQDTEGNHNKIMVEVHAYIPYHFALEAESESGSTDKWSVDNISDTSEIDSMMDILHEKYVKNGIGVVIDEFGARDKGGNIEARCEFAAYYVGAARERGITCCWWDNNAFTGNGENFGIFRRMVCKFLYPDLVDGMMKACE